MLQLSDAGQGRALEAQIDFEQAAVAGGTNLSELSLAIISTGRVDEAKDLAELGFGPAVIASLTGWPDRYAKKISDKANRKNRGGKVRSELKDTVKVPLLHSALSRFVMCIEHQLKFWGDSRISSRVFLAAFRYTTETMPDATMHIPASGFYSVAQEVLKGTVRTTRCKQCRNSYAHISVESGLTGPGEYDCPFCRMVNLMLPSRKRSIQNCVPSSFADMNLRGPLTRFSRDGAGGQDVRAVMALAFGAVSKRAY